MMSTHVNYKDLKVEEAFLKDIGSQHYMTLGGFPALIFITFASEAEIINFQTLLCSEA